MHYQVHGVNNKSPIFIEGRPDSIVNATVVVEVWGFDDASEIPARTIFVYFLEKENLYFNRFGKPLSLTKVEKNRVFGAIKNYLEDSQLVINFLKKRIKK